MPIYEYKCDDCGKVSEILVRNTQSPVNASCSQCKSANVNRKISAPGAVMTKGAGSMPEMPPMACPNQGQCGNAGSCPAAQLS
jgi:putative FmdB family regulatory protein